MKDFPFLISAALIYWGYNSDHIIISILFAVALESYRFVKFRLDFGRKDFEYISMLSTISAAGYLIYYINTDRQIGVISAILQFLPVILFPLVFFYLYGTSRYVNAKRLFLLFVTNKYSIVHPYVKLFRPDLFYFAAVLLGGSIKAKTASIFIVFALILPVLYKFRSKNHSLTRFFLSAVGVLLLSVLLQAGIHNSFYLLRDILTDLYIENIMKDLDKSMPIGDIGSLKDNFIIELRAESYNGKKPVIYLRDKVYNTYYNGRWSETGVSFLPFNNRIIEYGRTPLDSMRIYFFSRGKTDDIRMPFGTYDFAGINIGGIRLNSLGNVTSAYSQYLVDYKTYIDRSSTENLLGGTKDHDLKVNAADTLITDRIIDSLKLRDKPVKDVFTALSDYFILNYEYSLDYIDWSGRDKLSNFIAAKKGHCELFASLSCLVFRRLGYPSRYVTGYLVTEYSPLENKYIARKKDRHAWIHVWDNSGSWIEFDTTPPDISSSRKSSFFSRIYDLVSYGYYKLFMFKKENNDLFRNILLYSLIPLGLFLFYRILKDVKPNENSGSVQTANPYKKIPELEAIEDKLKMSGHLPGNETLGSWFAKLFGINLNEKLKHIKDHYYKVRYSDRIPDKRDKALFDKNLIELDNKEN